MQENLNLDKDIKQIKNNLEEKYKILETDIEYIKESQNNF